MHLLGRDRQPQLWVPSEKRAEGDLPLYACQRRPEADVDALAEGEVPVGLGPADVEDVRVREPPGIPVGRSQASRCVLPRREHAPVQLNVLLSDAPAHEFDQPPVPQCLLDYPLSQQLGIFFKLRQLLGVFH